jgi:hypothetical protein
VVAGRAGGVDEWGEALPSKGWMAMCRLNWPQDVPSLAGCTSRTRCAGVPRSTWPAPCGVKLGARDRAQLVVLAYESGLVRPGWLG